MPLPPRYRSKTTAAWLALLLGSLGAHRLYLHGLRDRRAWLYPLPTLVGLAGIHDRHRRRGRPEPLMVRQWGRLRGNRPDGPALGCPPGCRGPCVV